MKKLVLITLGILAVSPLMAQTSSPGNASGVGDAVTAPTSPAADADWAQVKTDVDTLQATNASDDKTARPLVVKLAQETNGFATKYPADPRSLNACMLWMQLGQLMAKKNWPGGPSQADVDKTFEALATAPGVPREKQAEIRGMQLERAMYKAAETQGDASVAWDGVEKKFVDFEKEFGADMSLDGQVPVLVKLRGEELSVLAHGSDTARFQALLKKLAQDPQPMLKELAQEKSDELKVLTDLKSKPMDLTFTAVDGTQVDLAKLRGKVVLVDFWATWCPPCREEVPGLVAAYQKYHDKGFEVVGISLDQDKNALLTFTKEHGMVWPQYFDGQGWQNAISSKYGIDLVPAMWLIGKDGKLVTTQGNDNLNGRVEALLAK